MSCGIHALDADIRETLFPVISEAFKNRNTGKEYILDSFPVPIWDNIRISRPKIFQGEEFRGYMPSKRRYSYEIRMHMIVTGAGEPVEFPITPGADFDLRMVQSDRVLYFCRTGTSSESSIFFDIEPGLNVSEGFLIESMSFFDKKHNRQLGGAGEDFSLTFIKQQIIK